MNFRPRFSSRFDNLRSSLSFSERRGDEKGRPISDDLYDRIPERFKKPQDDDKRGEEKKGDSSRRNQRPDRRNDSSDPRFFRSKNSNGGGGNGPGNGGAAPPRRSDLSTIIFFFSLAALGYFAYQSFYVAKSTEITWTAFNSLLDSNQVESATLKGTRLSGMLRNVPDLEYWPDVIPDGKNVFQALVEQYDRTNPDLAKQLDRELDDRLASEKLTLTRKKTTDAQGASVLQLGVTLEDGSVFKTVELPASATEDEERIAKESLVESYKLGLKLRQRWVLRDVERSRRVAEGAKAMVDVKTGKSLRKVFSVKYSCEAPAFAFSDQTIDKRLRERLQSYSSATPTDSSSWIMLLSAGVSILFLILLFRMFRNTSEQMLGGGMGGIIKSLAKRYEPNATKRVTFDDVAGMESVKAELVEIVDYLKNPAKYERMGARVPKGTLLFGPPGTGKTLLARAVAGEADVPFFSINGSEFIQMFVGVGASRVRDLFTTAKENAPSILFIDEIDAVGRQRGAGVGGGQDEREQTLNQILSEMDGFAQNDSVMVMASTNRPDVLDPALMRPGRFDRHITVGRPSMKGRVDIFKVYLKKIPYSSDVDVDKLAKTTAGFTGADIRNFVNEATLWATRNNKQVVEASDFDFAFEKISLGLKRDEIISPENKRKTAYHEAGHALVGWFVPNGSRVHKITIIPRGRALGVTWSLPDDDQLNYDESEARATLTHLLAGRAAEILVYNENSSGVENDLQRATELARNMVTRWGMSEGIGAVAYPDTETHPFLGREMSTGTRAYSEDAAKLIDLEVRKTIEAADMAARNLLIEKRDLFEALTDALVEEEELDEARIREILGPSPNDKKDEEEPAKQEEQASEEPTSGDFKEADGAIAPIPVDLGGDESNDGGER